MENKEGWQDLIKDLKENTDLDQVIKKLKTGQLDYKFPNQTEW